MPTLSGKPGHLKCSVCREAKIKSFFTCRIIQLAQTNRTDMLGVSCTSFACIVSNDARVTPYVACANHTPHHGKEYTYGGGECALRGLGETREEGRRREREGREKGERREGEGREGERVERWEGREAEKRKREGGRKRGRREKRKQGNRSRREMRKR